ncbi:MAG: hypothetical protein ACRDCB_10260 [Clostridium sp.]
MYYNLELLIKENSIEREIIANFIENTLANFEEKITGKKNFTYGEAIKIQEKFFPKYNIRYLFDVNNKK